MKNWLNLALVALVSHQTYGMDPIDLYALDDCPLECAHVTAATNSTSEYNILIPIEQPEDNEEVPQANDEHPSIYLIGEYLIGERHLDPEVLRIRDACIRAARLQQAIVLLEGFEYTQNQAGNATAALEFGGYTFGVENIHAWSLATTFETLVCMLNKSQVPQDYILSQFCDVINYFLDSRSRAMADEILADDSLVNNRFVQDFLKKMFGLLKNTEINKRNELIKRFFQRHQRSDILKFLERFLIAQLNWHDVLLSETPNAISLSFRQRLFDYVQNPHLIEQESFNNILRHLDNWRDIFVIQNMQRIQTWLESQNVQLPVIIFFGIFHVDSLHKKITKAGFDVQRSTQTLNLPQVL